MDDPALDPAMHRRALAGLSRLNRISRSSAILWSAIADLAPSAPGPLRVLDVATGSGDLPIALARMARARGQSIHLAACDRSEVAVDTARRSADRAGVEIDFFAHDALEQTLPAGFDVVISSLFLHHLTQSQAIALLRAMAQAAGRRVVVNDLLRSRMNLITVMLASRLVTTSHVVHVDGPLSVRAAFTLSEARELARSAELVNARVQSRFPARFLLIWDKP
jgi:2-polyprenyl-3-methyl-5-hydroxy-6-metoxy-1,4-benzoquinol methylase